MAGRGGGASLPGMDPTAVAALVAHQQQQQAPVNPQLRATLNAFWANQGQEMQRVNDFKNHNLPLARIKKIMKSDEDVRMISSEAPALFAKACEMFILEVRALSRPSLSPCAAGPGAVTRCDGLLRRVAAVPA